MIRLIIYFSFVAAIATGLAWFADRPDNLTIEWLGSEVRTSVFIAVLVLLIVFVAIVLAGWLGMLALTAPRRIARRLKARRTRIGNDAVRRGIFAAGAGDRLAALRAGAIAKKNLPDEPLALLLEAQSAQLNDDPIASRQAFERMLEKPEMAELGLRGLFMEAKKAGQDEAAKQFAERALSTNPALAWSSSALFEIQCKDEDWRAALKTLGIAKQYRHVPKAEADRRRALLLTALAAELEDTQSGKALAYALEAHTLLPSLIPAAVIAGRVLASQGNVNRATKLLWQAWRAAPHPDLALIYAHVRSGDAPRERLSRIKSLVASCPASLEGDIAVAVAAIEAKDWTLARAALEPHLAHAPQARVCRLMARLEAGQNRDAGRAREWLAKAGRAARDPMWVAPDGSVSTEWQARSPMSGALGAFEWKVPATGMEAAELDDIMQEMAALNVPEAEPEMPPASGLSVKLKDARESRSLSVPSPSQHTKPATPNNAAPGSVASEKNLAAEAAKDMAQANDLALANNMAPTTDLAPTNNMAPTTVLAPTNDISAAKEMATKPATAMPVATPDEKTGKSAATAAPATESAKSFTSSPAPASPATMTDAQAQAQRPDIRKPKIFVPDRPPDDPGPRAAEAEEASTPLSRFRGPS